MIRFAEFAYHISQGSGWNRIARAEEGINMLGDFDGR
jgi:hypothetical protein